MRGNGWPQRFRRYVAFWWLFRSADRHKQERQAGRAEVQFLGRWSLPSKVRSALSRCTTALHWLPCTALSVCD
ncbi:hypothetical protein CCHR01_03383 [Colletotrichum chrysophilum]|uniref:Uncharacterized protein n=1 Tax=Colletotrichum chrysophilum TaxID=1836956 RepID=A0AAD9EMH1_9PEZI|nr:hypothetical protein CCHR01_03383 [Colletotrichum chrysophilum]